jgi:hypothetical protein
MNRSTQTIIIVIGFLLATCFSALAADNTAVDGGSPNFTLTDSNTVSVTAAAISIVKEARDLSGNILGASTTVPAGSNIYFVLYVDNPTNAVLSDLRMIDAIVTGAGGFTVNNTSFEILNTVASPGIQMTAANITAWSTAGTGAGTWNGLTWNALTAAQGDDQLDWNLTAANQVTVGNVGASGNTALDVAVSGSPASEPYRAAVRFVVTVNP